MPTWLQLLLLISLSVGVPALIFGRTLAGALSNRRLRRHGTAAKATIVEVRGTNTKINNEPVCDIVLEVEPDSEPPFQATARQLVSSMSLVELKRGKLVTVRFDPRDRTKVVLIGTGHVSVSTAEAAQMVRSAQRLLDELNAPGAGVAAPALVRAFSPTGIELNGPNPLARLEVKVLPVGGAPFDATIVGVFGAPGLHKYQPGKEIAVRFDPADHARVTMDLSETLTATM